jgi:nucleotide-binding universal stress UspA family protein
MYRKVVVPLDGSELAEGVEPHVAAVIRDRGSQVYLLSVAPLTKGTAPGVVDLPPSSVGAQDEESRIERQLVQYLRTAAQRLEPIAADVHVQVRFGRPADEILAFVGEVEADLIAMSTHGRSGVSRWVFGSVAERVLRGAACPVLLVRAGFGQPRTAARRLRAGGAGIASREGAHSPQPYAGLPRLRPDDRAG